MDELVAPDLVGHNPLLPDLLLLYVACWNWAPDGGDRRASDDGRSIIIGSPAKGS